VRAHCPSRGRGIVPQKLVACRRARTSRGLARTRTRDVCRMSSTKFDRTHRLLVHTGSRSRQRSFRAPAKRRLAPRRRPTSSTRPPPTERDRRNRLDHAAIAPHSLSAPSEAQERSRSEREALPRVAHLRAGERWGSREVRNHGDSATAAIRANRCTLAVQMRTRVAARSA